LPEAANASTDARCDQQWAAADPIEFVSPRPWVTLSLLLGVFSINYMDRQILAILAQPIKTDLALSDVQVGLLYGAAFAVLYATAGMPIARHADRADRARIINWSLVFFSLMSAACGLAANYWQLIAARIGVAIGEGGTNPPSHSMISDLYPLDRRSTAMAVFSLGPHIGVLLGFLIGGWVGQFWGWRPAFVVAGLLGLIFAIPSWLYLREVPRENNATDVVASVPIRSVLRTMTSQASGRHLLLGATVFSIAGYSVIGWLPALLIRSGGLGPGAVGSILALVLGVVGSAGTLLGGALADRLGKASPAWRLKLVAVVLLLMAPAWAATFLASTPATMVALLVLPGAFLGFYLGPTFAMIQSIVEPGMRATAAALLLFFINVVGLGLGPLVVGALSDALSSVAGPDSLRFALLAVPPLCVWAAYHYYVASRTIALHLL
jgi:predicted MFS family arabinose efflux permease